MLAKFALDPFSAYKYDQKADKVDFPIYHFGSILLVISTRIKRGSWAI